MFEDSTREPDGLNQHSPLLSMPDLPPLGMDPPSLAKDFRRHFSRTLGAASLMHLRLLLGPLPIRGAGAQYPGPAHGTLEAHPPSL